jgi:tetratricopeptide (TPR) repeat protein
VTAEFPHQPAVEASIREMLGKTYLDLGETAQAIRQLDQAVALRSQDLGRDHIDTLNAMTTLADAYTAAGQLEKALPLYLQALAHLRSVLGADHLDTMACMNHVARIYLASEPALAEPVAREALANWIRKAGDDWRTYQAGSLLGGSLLAQKKFAEAEPFLLQGYEGMKSREAKIPAGAQNQLSEAGGWIIRLYDGWGKKDKAAEWRKRLEVTKRP